MPKTLIKNIRGTIDSKKSVFVSHCESDGLWPDDGVYLEINYGSLIETYSVFLLENELDEMIVSLIDAKMRLNK